MSGFNRVINRLKDVVIGQPIMSTTKIENESTHDPQTVILHIYSISERVNRFSFKFGLGLYHTAVEIYGQEHSFVGHPFKFSGIVSTIPKTAAYIYLEGLDMGKTTMTEREIGNCLKELGQQFTGDSYHLLQKNCNHFASTFVKRLCNGTPPSYINRAANSASSLPFLDTIFSIKLDTEKFFIEILYLTFYGDLTSVIETLDVDYQTNLTRYISYIESSFDDQSIPKCLPYYPVMKNENPFKPSKTLVELVKTNLCANFIFTQSKFVYDQAFEIDEKLKSKKISLTNIRSIQQEPTFIIDDESLSSSSDYSTDIHQYLDRIYRQRIETI